MAMFLALLHRQKDWQTLHLGMGSEWQLFVGKDQCGHLTKVKVVAHDLLLPWYSCLGFSRGTQADGSSEELSCINGYESPPHMEVKKKYWAKRVTKTVDPSEWQFKRAVF